ncbi:MAG: hypothetical protein Q4E05_07010 [Pseudoclavibacter sp.]|nr:hypothetical protein [Pseudoclavibacter sp.]
MRRYRRAVRLLFGAVFVVGGVVHLVLGRSHPESYAVFGDTALLPQLDQLWRSFVVPRIAWLTVLLGLLEIVWGLGMAWRRTLALAAWSMLLFLLFVTVLGYGWPASSPLEDVLKNRLPTLVMAAMLLPLLRTSRRPPRGAGRASGLPAAAGRRDRGGSSADRTSHR